MRHSQHTRKQFLQYRTVASCLPRLRMGSAAALFLLGTIFSRAGAAEIAPADTYGLGPGDRVTVTVFEQPALSGDFFVDAAGRIRLPLVGEIPIGDLTVGDVEREITQRLADGFLQRPVVSVRISDFRPVYILGDVRAPGSYPFRYGALVISAVAQAGGFGLEDRAQTAKADYFAADERFHLLEASRQMLRVKAARLAAQLNKARDFPAAEFPEASSDKALADIVAQQKALFDIETRALDLELAALREQLPHLDAQITNVKEQANAEASQLDLIKGHIQDFDQLAKSGLANRFNGIELQREEARNRGNIAGFAAQIAALEIARGEVRVRMRQAENAYFAKVATELEDARARLQEIEATLPTARAIRDTRLRLTQLGVSAAGAARHDFVIIRRQKNGPQSIQATETTPIVPGDIIQVTTDGSPNGAAVVSMLQPDKVPEASGPAPSINAAATH